MRIRLGMACAIAVGIILFAGCTSVNITPPPEPTATTVVTNLILTQAPASTPTITPTPGVRSEAPRLIRSLDQLTSESTDIFIGTVVRLLDERANTSRVGEHGENEDPTYVTLNRQYDVEVERYLKGDAEPKVVLIMEEEKTRILWQTPGRPEHVQEYVPEVAPVPPTIGQRYLFFTRPWGWGVFPGKLLAYMHPSRFALKEGMATVEDQYFVRATKDKYYPSKLEADFLAEVQAAIVRNPTKIPDLVGSPGYVGQ